MAFSTDAKEKLFKLIFGQADTNVLLPDCYLGLSTTVPAADGTNFTEPPTANGYARSLLGSADAASTWLMGFNQNGDEENTSIIYFPEASSSWGTVRSWGLFTAATGGRPLLFGDLTTATSIPAEYVPLFRAGSFTMSVL